LTSASTQKRRNTPRFRTLLFGKEIVKTFFYKCSNSGRHESTPQTQNNVSWISSKADLKITGPYRNCRGEAGTKNEPKWYFVTIQKNGWKVGPHVSNQKISMTVRVHPPSLFKCNRFCYVFSSRFWDLGILPHIPNSQNTSNVRRKVIFGIKSLSSLLRILR